MSKNYELLSQFWILGQFCFFSQVLLLSQFQPFNQIKGFKDSKTTLAVLYKSVLKLDSSFRRFNNSDFPIFPKTKEPNILILLISNLWNIRNFDLD